MAIHFVECAALTELPAAQKLVLMAIADAADKSSRIGGAGLPTVMQWSGLKRSRALAVIAELVAAGYLRREAAGRIGRNAEFVVFPAGCCPLHGPIGGGPGRPDSAPLAGSTTPDPAPEDEGPGEGPIQGPVAAGPLPISLSPEVPPSPGSGGRASRVDGTNPRALRAAAEQAQRRAAVQAHTADRLARFAAIEGCERCDTGGYLPGGRVCDHDPDAPQRAARGMALVRAELADRQEARA